MHYISYLPLQGIPKQGVAVSKAREHFLLKSERPSVVTILSLVRDASSRLPGGEGTRAEVRNLCLNCVLFKRNRSGLKSADSFDIRICYPFTP